MNFIMNCLIGVLHRSVICLPGLNSCNCYYKLFACLFCSFLRSWFTVQSQLEWPWPRPMGRCIQWLPTEALRMKSPSRYLWVTIHVKMLPMRFVAILFWNDPRSLSTSPPLCNQSLERKACIGVREASLRAQSSLFLVSWPRIWLTMMVGQCLLIVISST